jgi:hypothetical protein
MPRRGEMKMPNIKYIQSLDNHIYSQLNQIAKQKGIGVQQLIRAIIIPEWVRSQRQYERNQVAES